MKIKKYVNLIKDDDYYGFYKILERDFTAITDELTNKVKCIDSKLYYIYFDFLIGFGKSIKNSTFYDSLNLYIDDYFRQSKKSQYDFTPYNLDNTDIGVSIK